MTRTTALHHSSWEAGSPKLAWLAHSTVQLVVALVLGVGALSYVAWSGALRPAPGDVLAELDAETVDEAIAIATARVAQADAELSAEESPSNVPERSADLERAKASLARAEARRSEVMKISSEGAGWGVH